mgnify:CR=1 FL=1
MVLRVWRTELRATSRYKYNGNILHVKMPDAPIPSLISRANVPTGDPTNWGQLQMAPMSDQTDITTLRVGPEAQQLKLEMIRFMDIYPLDGKAIHAMTTLNTENFNYVLNTFAPQNSNRDEVNPKIMSYIKHYIRNIHEQDGTEPNEGPKWWQDINAKLDPTARPPHTPTPEVTEEMEEDSKHNKRGRSPQDGDEESWANFQVSLREIVDDISNDDYRLDDINYLMKQSIRFHKQGMMPYDGIDGEGTFRQWSELKKDISCINVLECAKLLHLDLTMWEFWHSGLDGRPARHLNALLGQEIDKLINIVTYYNVQRMELQRHHDSRTRYWKLCPSNNDWDGTCDAPHADRCRHIHAKAKP